MKKIALNFITIISIIFLSINTNAQEEKVLAKKNGIKISYQLLLEKSSKKNDKYILIINAENTGDKDLFYEVNLYKNKDGKLRLPILPEDRGFTKIKIRNAKGLFSKGKSIIGDNTKYLTTNIDKLFVVKKGDIYTIETTFKIKKGQKPLITNTFTASLNLLEDYDLKINSNMLEGSYTSNCGNTIININSKQSSEKGSYLIQTTNGKQFIWVKKSDDTFTRENNNDYTLTFNKNDNSFLYSTTDGITCNWIKNNK